MAERVGLSTPASLGPGEVEPFVRQPKAALVTQARRRSCDLCAFVRGGPAARRLDLHARLMP